MAERVCHGPCPRGFRRVGVANTMTQDQRSLVAGSAEACTHPGSRSLRAAPSTEGTERGSVGAALGGCEPRKLRTTDGRLFVRNGVREEALSLCRAMST